MGFNDPTRPKILRTQLSEEMLRDFKALAAKKDISMAKYLEKLIAAELDKTAVTQKQINDIHQK